MCIIIIYALINQDFADKTQELWLMRSAQIHSYFH